MAQNTCPPSDRFQALLQGNLPSDVAESLAHHVEQCAACATTVANLEHDTLADALRAGGGKSPVEEPALQNLLDRTRAAVASGPNDATNPPSSPEDMTLDSDAGSLVANANETLQLLSKPQAPGEIGRLGHYRILRQLGQGGMGMVFEAEDMKLERKVALKVMKPEIARNAVHRERFLREARTAAKVESDHICPIYQVGEENGMPFIAMPFLKGEPLDERVKRGLRLTVDEAVRIGLEVAEGLSAAHDAGLIHRDIKPGNIWLETRASGKPRARILDFGLARVQNDDVHITTSGAILGTPAYMAPEQARGEKTVDVRADLFSLGCVLYALCTGDIPFKAETTMGVLMALATHEPKPPHEISNAIPRPLSELIMQLLQKDAARRPASAREVIGRLSQMTTLPATQPDASPAPTPSPAGDTGTVALSEVAVPQTPVTTAQRRKSRKPLAIALACGFLACVLVLLGGVVYLVTNNGTIEIKTEDKNVKVIVEENGGKITVLDPMSKQTWVVDTGKYTIKLEGNPDGLEIEMPADRAFEMKRGGKQVVTIRKVQAPAPTPATIDTNRRAAEWVLSVGGALNLRADGKVLLLRKGDSLPASPFEVNELSMMHVKNLDDENVENLQSAPRVASLRLHDNKKLGDAGLAKLTAYPGLTNLTKLVLNDTAVTDVGLEHVTKFKDLTELHLGASKLSPKALVPLRSLKLQSMMLYECHNLGDDAMAELASFPSLENLTLSYIPISDAGLENLAKCKTLRTLVLKKCAERATYLKRTPLSESGIKKLAAARPDVRIVLEDFVIAPGGNLDPDRRAAEWVLSVGGSVRGVPDPGRLLKSGDAIPAAPWRLIMANVVSNPKATDDGLRVFENCKHLNSIYLANTPITDAGLAVFKDCKDLTVLAVDGTDVSDAGLAVFQDCKRLEQVSLNETRVTDKGLVHFDGCKKVFRLLLSKTAVGDAGLAVFKDCRLATLDLRGARVTDAGLGQLRDRNSLVYVHLDNLQVSDKGVALFKGCKDLLEFNLNGTNLTDDGLEHFRKLGSLKALRVKKTKVTAAGLNKLAAALPQCKIEWDGGVLIAEVPIDPDRRAAEWVLSIGGAVRVRQGKQEPLVDKLDALPDGKLDLLAVFMLSNARATDAGLEQLRGCDRLGCLEFTGSPIGDAGLAAIKGLPGLTDLGLASTQITDAGLAHLKEIKSLYRVNLGHTAITGEGLSHLRASKNLGLLILDGVELSDAGFKHVAELTALHDLALQGVPVTDGHLAMLTPLKKLTVLILTHTKVTDAGLAHLTSLPNLGKLGLAKTAVGDAGMAHVGKLTKLTWLELNKTAVSDEGMVHLKQLKNLAAINLLQTRVTDAGLAHFKEMRNLEGITLVDTQVSDRSIDIIAGWPRLVHLRLEGTKITKAGVKKLAAALPKCRIEWDGGVLNVAAPIDPDRRAAEWLLSIAATHTQITVKQNGKEWVAKELPDGPFALTGVNLMHNSKVTDASLANLRDCEDLTLLNLGYTGIGDEGVSHFKDCKKLTSLYLPGRVTAIGMANFKNCKDLTELALHGVTVNDVGLSFFSHCKGLTRLSLRSAALNAVTMAHFKDCKDLKFLDLADSNVKLAELAHFKNCKKLEHLDLAATKVGDADVAHFKDCRKLTVLILDKTNVADKGLALFTGCKNLANLLIVKTSVTKAGVDAIRQALPRCRIEWDGGVLEPKAVDKVGDQRQYIGHQKPVAALAFTPDGQSFLSAGDGELWLWDGASASAVEQVTARRLGFLVRVCLTSSVAMSYSKMPGDTHSARAVTSTSRLTAKHYLPMN